MTTIDISIRQKEIIEASGKILISKGIKGLTTKNLAFEMGFSESAIYRHFKNKEDIIVLMFSAMQENFKIRLNEIISRDESALIKLQLVFESQFQYFAENPSSTIAVLTDEIYFEGDRVKDAFLKIFGYKQSVIRAVLQQGKSEGTIIADIDNDQLLHLIMGSYRFQMLRWRYDNFEFDLQEQGKLTLNSLLTLISITN